MASSLRIRMCRTCTDDHGNIVHTEGMSSHDRGNGGSFTPIKCKICEFFVVQKWQKCED